MKLSAWDLGIILWRTVDPQLKHCGTYSQGLRSVSLSWAAKDRIRIRSCAADGCIAACERDTSKDQFILSRHCMVGR